jgi:protease-4
LTTLLTGLRKSIGDDKARVVSYYRPGSYKGSIYADAEAKEGLAGIFSGMNSFSGGSFMYLW